VADEIDEGEDGLSPEAGVADGEEAGGHGGKACKGNIEWLGRRLGEAIFGRGTVTDFKGGDAAFVDRGVKNERTAV
jgi:hypothetical protein